MYRERTTKLLVLCSSKRFGNGAFCLSWSRNQATLRHLFETWLIRTFNDSALSFFLYCNTPREDYVQVITWLIRASKLFFWAVRTFSVADSDLFLLADLIFFLWLIRIDGWFAPNQPGTLPEFAKVRISQVPTKCKQMQSADIHVFMRYFINKLDIFVRNKHKEFTTTLTYLYFINYVQFDDF